MEGCADPVTQAFDLTLAPTVCPEEPPVDAVVVTLAAGDGGGLEAPRVQWDRADLGDPPADCVPNGGTWGCAPDVTGALRITGQAEGHEAVSAYLQVEGDGCHPVPQAITLTLPPG